MFKLPGSARLKSINRGFSDMYMDLAYLQNMVTEIRNREGKFPPVKMTAKVLVMAQRNTLHRRVSFSLSERSKQIHDFFSSRTERKMNGVAKRHPSLISKLLNNMLVTSG